MSENSPRSAAPHSLTNAAARHHFEPAVASARIGLDVDPAVDPQALKTVIGDEVDHASHGTHVEYAYLATFDGPGTNRIVAVTGTANASLQESAT